MSCELGRLNKTCHPWPQVETLSNGGWENWGKSWRLVDPINSRQPGTVDGASPTKHLEKKSNERQGQLIS